MQRDISDAQVLGRAGVKKDARGKTTIDPVWLRRREPHISLGC